jgi:hypothetical protein
MTFEEVLVKEYGPLLSLAELAMIAEHQKQLETLGRPAASVLRVFQHMQRNPIVSIPAAAQKIGISAPTVAKSLDHMQRLGTYLGPFSLAIKLAYSALACW